MAKLESWTCDVCGIQKQPSNNWWKVYLIEGGAMVLEWGAETKTLGYSLESASAHICGQECLHKWISKGGGVIWRWQILTFTTLTKMSHSMYPYTRQLESMRDTGLSGL